MIGTFIDTTEIQQKIGNADEINQKASQRERYKELQEVTTAKEVELTKQATILDDLREKRKEMVKKADMPID